MKVSVVIPVHNRAGMIRNAIASALSQHRRPAEIIVVDDGSTDGTATEAESTPARVISQPRRGASAARNAGIDAATGDVVAFLDSDDSWWPTRLDHTPELPGPALLMCGFTVTGRSTPRPVVPGAFRGDAHRRFLRLSGGPVTTSCMMIDRRVAPDLRFDEDLAVLEDLDLAIRATRDHDLGHTTQQLVVKHAGTPNRLYTPEAELPARTLLLELHAVELAADPVAHAAHLLAKARCEQALGINPEKSLAAAREVSGGLSPRLTALGWRLAGGRGLDAVASARTFLRENPVARVRSMWGGGA